jgi:hypothetical protein
MGWQWRRRWRKRCKPRAESNPSVATVSNVRGLPVQPTYGPNSTVYVNVVLDCADRECIGRS